MADQQEQPEKRPDAAPQTPAQPSAPDVPAKAAAKKAPAKKTPAKKAPAKAAKKTPAKKAPAKKAPAKAATPPSEPAPTLPLAATNGAGPVREGAKEAAAQAKTTVDQAIDSVAAPLVQPVERGRSPLPVAVAIAVSLLAVLVVRQLRRNSDDS